MPNRFYRRRWDETRGDRYDDWGPSVWYFEVGDDGWPVRQVEVYDAGRVLRYGPDHPEDRYGGLGEASLHDSSDDWSDLEITQAEFERAWRSDRDGPTFPLLGGSVPPCETRRSAIRSRGMRDPTGRRGG